MARVLIVDDETGLRKTMQQFLLRDGHDVEVVEQAESALEMLATGDFEIVISDIILPQMNGIELLHCIRADYPHILVILITGEPSVTTASEAVRANAFDYLDKPIPKNVICQAVRRAENELKRRALEPKDAPKQTASSSVSATTTKETFSASWLGSFIQNSPTVSFLFGEGRILEANTPMKRWMERFGMASFSPFSFWKGEERARIEQAFIDVEQGNKQSKTLETVLEFPNGSQQSVTLFLLRAEWQNRPHVFGQFFPSETPQSENSAETSFSPSESLQDRSYQEKCKHLEIALEGAGLGLWEMNLQTDTVRYNRRWAEMLGYSLEDIRPSKRTWEHMIHPEDRPRVADLVSNYLIGDVARYETEMRLKTRQGTWKWIYSQAQVVERDAQGKIIKVIGTHQDIERQKKLTRSVRESEYRFEAIFQNSVQGVCVFDTSGQLTKVNEKLCKITGFSASDLSQMTELQLAHPDDYDEGEKRFRELIDGACDHYFQKKRYLRNDGGIVWVELFVKSIRNEKNQVTSAIGIVLDISDRIQATETLEKKEMQFRLASRGGEVGFWDWHLDTDEVFISEEYAHMLGYEDDELQADPRSILNLIVLDDKPRFIREMYRHLEGKTESFQIEARMKAKNGEARWMFFRGKVVERNEQGRALRFAGSQVDITEKKALQDALRDSEQKLATLIRQSPDYIATIDLDKKVRFINRLPQKRDSILEGCFNISDFVHTRSLSVFLATLKDSLANRAVAPFEMEGLDGEIFLTRLEPLEIEGKISEVMVIATPISKFKRNAQTLEETRSRYQALFEDANDAIFIHDEDGNLLDVNDRACKVLGYSKQALQKMTWNQISLQKRSDELKTVIEKGSGVYEATLLASNGNPIIFEINSRLVHANGHNVMISIARDLTERFRAEAERRNLISIIENSNEFIGVSDLEGRVTYVNEAGKQLVGLETDEEVRKTRIFDFVPNELRKVISDVTIPMILGNRLYENQSVLRHFKTGELIDVMITTFPLKSQVASHPVGIATIIRDIREFKRAVQKLKESEERFRIVADATFEAIFLHRDGIVIDANRAASSLFGYSHADMVGNRLVDILGWNETEAIEPQAIVGKVPHRIHLKRKGNESFLAEIQSSILSDVDPPMEISIVRDMTVQEIEKRHSYRMQSMAAQIGQEDATSQLAASMAREFSNLLIDIKGSLSLARIDRLISEPLKGTFKEIDSTLHQASDLVSRLLTFSRRQFVQAASVDLNVLLERMHHAFESMQDHNVRVELDLARPLATIRADKKQLETVILNLVENSVEAMPEGGMIKIKTSSVTADETFYDSHPDFRAGHYVLLTFADNGIGMDQQTRHRAFDPFFTTKTDSANIGFGLSSVYGIIRQCQGTVELYSQPGKGTTFHFYFPAEERAADFLNGQPSPLPSLEGHETILFVEEEETIRNVCRKLFEKKGYHVLEADSSPAALSCIQDYEGDIHALVTAVVLNDMDGFTLARHLKTRHPDASELFTSGYPKSSLMSHYPLPDQEFELLAKPFSPMDLLRRLRYLLDEKNARE